MHVSSMRSDFRPEQPPLLLLGKSAMSSPTSPSTSTPRLSKRRPAVHSFTRPPALRSPKSEHTVSAIRHGTIRVRHWAVVALHTSQYRPRYNISHTSSTPRSHLSPPGDHPINLITLTTDKTDTISCRLPQRLHRTPHDAASQHSHGLLAALDHTLVEHRRGEPTRSSTS